MIQTNKHLRRAVVGLLLAAAILPFTAGSAGAIGTERFICSAAGSVTTTALPDTWSIVGQGSCVSQDNPYFLSFTAAGTSEGLGLCTEPDAQPFFLQNLNLTVTGTITSSDPLNPTVYPLVQKWAAPVTTYPLGTPFLVTRPNGDLIGGGVFWNHIFLRCQGSPVATFQWVYTA